MAIKKKKTSMYDTFDENSVGNKVVVEGELVYGSLLQKRVPAVVGPKDDGKPRYSISIKNPVVVEGADNDLGQALVNPNLTNSFYKNKDGEEMYSVSSRSKFPVNIFTRETGADSLPAPELLENELAPGQKVGVMLSLYENKTWQSVGLSLDGVIIDSPENIEYFASSSTPDYSDVLGEKTNALSKYKRTPNQTSDVAEDDAAAENTEEVPAETSTKINELFD